MTPVHLRRGTVLSALIFAVFSTLVLAPTSAQAGDTTVTFVINAGALTISQPATAGLGTTASGASLTAQLGAVTVTDARAALVATWTTTASTTVFTTGGGSGPETVAKSAVSYASGLATGTTGVGVFTPGQATTILAVALTTSQTAYSLTAGVGNNTATWNPTLIIAVPAAAVAGTYTGTVTHSVA